MGPRGGTTGGEGHHASTAMSIQAHGRRLACFRPHQRFRLDTLHEVTGSDSNGSDGSESSKTTRVSCDCAFQVLQCHPHSALITSGNSSSAETLDANVEQLLTTEESYRQRCKKWSEKFHAHEYWKQERVCQKWKENHKRFVVEQQSSRHLLCDRSSSLATTTTKKKKDEEDEQRQGNDNLSPTKAAGKSVKMALTNFASAAEVLIHSRQFDALLRAGVPPHLRGKVWWICSGAAEKRQAAHESYSELVERLHMLNKCAEMDIEKDLPRTFPVSQQNGKQQQQPDSRLTASQELRGRNIGELRRVLQAYSLRNPTVGYCQSMNFLAAVLLHQMEEEEAFWVLVSIVEELIPFYHTRSMAGSRADQRVFSDLVQQKLPSLYQHLQTLRVDFEPFTLKWFLCLFVNTLPFEPVMRIWDVFFCEGSHVLLRVGLTLLKLSQPRILACDDAIEVYEMFKISHEVLHEITASYRSGLLNRDECVCDTLIRLAMDKSFVGPIPFDSLHELRQFYRNEIEAELADAEIRRQLRAEGSNSTTISASSSTTDEVKETDGFAATETSRGMKQERDDADRELSDYEFVDESSPTKHIHFSDLYDSGGDPTDYFIDVKYERTMQKCR